MANYIGITLGPVMRIQEYAKKTRGIWASSYIFSFIAKHIVRKYFFNDFKFIKPTLSLDLFTTKDVIEGITHRIIHDGIKIEDIQSSCNDILRGLRGDATLCVDKKCTTLEMLIGELWHVLSLCTIEEFKSLNGKGYDFKTSDITLNIPSPEDLIDYVKGGEDNISIEEVRKRCNALLGELLPPKKAQHYLNENYKDENELKEGIGNIYSKYTIYELSGHFRYQNEGCGSVLNDYAYTVSILRPEDIIEGIYKKNIFWEYTKEKLHKECNELITRLLDNNSGVKQSADKDKSSSHLNIEAFSSPAVFESKLRDLVKGYTSNDLVGRFPDQYVFLNDRNVTLDELRSDCEGVLKMMSKNIALVLGRSEDIVYRYLRHSIRIILLQKDFDDDLSEKEIIMQMQQAMDVMECRDQYCSDETENYIAEYIENASNFSLVINEVFGENKHTNLFNTIVECTTCGEYTKSTDKKTRRKLTKKLNNGAFDSQLKPYQKYIAIVCGDGDNFGKTLASLGSGVAGVFKVINENIKAYIESYGGQLVYQGGDDVYFFAPVYNPYVGKDIFHLIKDINDFIQEVIDNNDEIKQKVEFDKKPAFSFGVSISYHKFPIAESRQKAESLLGEIKHVKDGELKNKIRWCVRKHSGFSFEGLIDKNKDGEFAKYVDFIDSVTNSTIKKADKKTTNEEVETESNFLHSVVYWLNSDSVMLSFILLSGDRDIKLENYMNSRFQEKDGHGKYKTFLSKVKNFLLSYEKDSGLVHLNALLRYISLLIKKE